MAMQYRILTEVALEKGIVYSGTPEERPLFEAAEACVRLAKIDPEGVMQSTVTLGHTPIDVLGSALSHLALAFGLNWYWNQPFRMENVEEVIEFATNLETIVKHPKFEDMCSNITVFDEDLIDSLNRQVPLDDRSSSEEVELLPRRSVAFILTEAFDNTVWGT